MDPAHLTAMVVPNAVDILRDKLPPFADPYDEEIYLRKIAGALPEGVWFDSSSVLRQHSGEELYYRTDHHWKTLSAYYTFEAWAGEKGLAGDSAFSFQPVTVTDSFEGTIASRLGIVGRADSIERFDPEIPFDYYLIYNQSDDIRNTVYQDSFLERKDKYAYFYGGNFGLIQAKMPEHETGRKLLVIKDSYAHCFVPFTYALFDQVDMLVATGRKGVVMSKLSDRIRAAVTMAHYVDPTDERGTTIFNTEVLFQMLDNLFKGVNFLIWLVGLGTLLAGAIGVSNIMMVTVRERTTEIGIRRAIGATPRMILSQIISESIVLTLVAGMSGILFGVMILQMLELGNTEDGIVMAHFQIGFWTAIFCAFVVSSLGVLAGLAPAARAMSIKPVDAMRDE